MKMDLVLNNLQRLVCHKTQATSKLSAVLFDLENAYDTSWPYGILKNLSLLGRHLIFIKYFLEDWTFKTQINNTLSNPKPQEIGVFQNTIVYVILFMVKMNKITTHLPLEIH